MISSGETDIGALKDNDLHCRMTDFIEMLTVITLKRGPKLNNHAARGKMAGKQIINSMDQLHPPVFVEEVGWGGEEKEKERKEREKERSWKQSGKGKRE